MQKLYCVLSLFLIIFDSTARAVPLRYRRAFSYIANETACTVDHIVYKDGDPIPTDDPCESCKCRPPGFSCVLRECEVKTGCKAIRRAGECCPQYQCGCEHNGNYYGDGDRIPNAESPCYSCYCQGSSITCSLADCKFRFDCEPEYILGECCPRYDHCPPENIPTTVKSTVVPILTTLFTKSTTTPMPTITTPSTSSAVPFTTITTTPSTTPSTTLSTTPSTTPTPSTTSTTTTTTISPPTTSPATTITVPTTTTPLTTTSPSTTTVVITTLPSTLPPITEKDVTTSQSAYSESQTISPTEIITETPSESTNISLPELTSPPTTELVESSSTEYSTTKVSKELSESKTTTEYSTNAQTIGSSMESTTLNVGDITSIDIQTSSPLYETTRISETTTETLKTDQKVNQSVTDLIPSEIVSEVSLESTPNVITLEPEVTTILPEIPANISETTTELNSESISNEETTPLATKPIISEEITTKGSVEDINTTPKLTTQSIGNVEEITSKPDVDQEIKPLETSTQSKEMDTNPPKTEIIESNDTNEELVPTESILETTTQALNVEYSKTESILTTTEVIKSGESQKEPEVTTTEKSTEGLQKEIVVTQTIVSETTTPSEKVYETTLKIEDLNPEEKPIESDISSDSMIEIPTMDPTVVKSDELSVSSSTERSTSPKFTISAVVEDKSEEITTKEPLITNTTQIVLSDGNTVTTQTVPNEEMIISDNTKAEELTTRLSEDKSESLNTENPNYGEDIEEAVTQTLATTTLSSKVSAETKDKITTESVTEGNILETETITPQNTTIKSIEVNIETTTQKIATETLSSNPSSESIVLVSSEESSPQTTTISDILNNIRTEMNTNESSIDSNIETTTSSKQLLDLNTESVSYSPEERGTEISTSDMN